MGVCQDILADRMKFLSDSGWFPVLNNAGILEIPVHNLDTFLVKSNPTRVFLYTRNKNAPNIQGVNSSAFHHLNSRRTNDSRLVSLGTLSPENHFKNLFLYSPREVIATEFCVTDNSGQFDSRFQAGRVLTGKISFTYDWNKNMYVPAIRE